MKIYGAIGFPRWHSHSILVDAEKNPDCICFYICIESMNQSYEAFVKIIQF